MRKISDTSEKISKKINEENFGRVRNRLKKINENDISDASKKILKKINE